MEWAEPGAGNINTVWIGLLIDDRNAPAMRLHRSVGTPWLVDDKSPLHVPAW
jgi:hypothetical protein